uniref:Caspase-8-like n=1 Tax=Saccoglossus kowalevskii TaxID=10224 RepID=A0ABM0MM05_SACKO|nr:PREDICTED: caspase-8-like [Saccoglossus kowalevskii]
MFEVETLRVVCMTFMKRSRKVPANAANSENTSQKVSSPQKCTVEVLKKAGGVDAIQPLAMKELLHCHSKHGKATPEMVGRSMITSDEKEIDNDSIRSLSVQTVALETKHGEVKPEMISKPPRKPKKMCERQKEDSLEYSNDELMSESSNDCEEESDSEFSDMFSCPLCEETCADLSKLKENLRCILVKLKFKVQLHTDLNADAIHKVLLDLSHQDHSDHDSIIVCVLSHYGPGKIYGCDGKPLTVAELAEYLMTSKSPQLDGKPKLFFLTATPESSPPIFPPDVDVWSDFLFSYAASCGQMIWRHPETRENIYIKKLVERLDKNHTQQTVMEILKDVISEVDQEVRTSKFAMKRQQTPCFVSLLKKNIHLK